MLTSGLRDKKSLEQVKGLFKIDGQDKNYEQNNIIRISLRDRFKK